MSNETNSNAEQEKEEVSKTQDTAHEVHTEAEAGEKNVDFKEKFYYVAAEMDNLQKRFEREKQNLVKFGLESVLKDLVQVVDTFDMSLNAMKADQDAKVKNIVNGIEMVQKQFLGALAKHGLTPIVTVGQAFDPNFHEALMQEESDDEENMVLKEFQRGYMLNGRLMRAAKVIVSKKKNNQ